jgi:hypothetical protein
VTGAGVLLDERKVMENVRMTKNSPWCRGASQRGRRRSNEGDRRRAVIGMPSSPVPIGGFPDHLACLGDWQDHSGAPEISIGARVSFYRPNQSSPELVFWWSAQRNETARGRRRTRVPRAYP